MKKALMVSTIVGFIATFEKSDIGILQGMGYEVHCACNNKKIVDENKLKELDDLGVVRHQIDFDRNPLGVDNLKAYKQLKSLIERERYDIVHCHTPMGGVLARLAFRKYRKRGTIVIYTAHGFHFFKGAPMKNWLIYYTVEKCMSRFTDVLITINSEDYAAAKNRLYAKKIARIHGVGIEIEKFANTSVDKTVKKLELGLKADDKILLSVGRLKWDKNHMVVLKAMKQLSKQGYKYLICGEGEERKSYEDFIKKNYLQDSIFLLGFRKDISELLKITDIYVFPSLFEGVSVALMEAVAAKIPVACSKVRGNVDTVVTEESYFAPFSEEQLINVIRHISSMDTTMMVEENYKNLLKYDINEVKKEMTRIYKSVNKSVELRKRK